MAKNKMLDDTAEVLVIVGAINWGLFAFADMNLVAMLPDMLINVVYGAVAASGLYIGYNKFMKK